jgi:predicted aspartyl protease
MSGYWRAFARSAVCATVVWAACPQGALAECKMGVLGELNVSTLHNRLVTDGSINGQPVKVLLDTGSSFSFIWENAARRLNLSIVSMPGINVYGIGGKAKSQQTALKHLQAGSFYANDMHVVVLAGDHGQNADAPAFVFGDDLFSHFDTEFDLAHGKIRLLRTDGCAPDQVPYWAEQGFSMADIEGWDPRTPQIRVKVLVNGKSVTATFDTGIQTSTITRLAAEGAGVTPWLKDASSTGKLSGVGSAKEDAWVGKFDNFAVGDEAVKNVSLLIADLFRADREVEAGYRVAREVEGLPTMLIGCDFFLAHRIVVLNKAHKLVFTYNGGPIFQVVQRAKPDSGNAGP